MAAPTVRAYATPTNGTDAAPAFSVGLPAGVTTGDLLLAFCANDSGVTEWTASPGNGWVKLSDEVITSARFAVYAKIAGGTNTLSIAGSNNQDYSCVTLAVQVGTHAVVDVSTDIVIPAAAEGASGNADPPASGTVAAKEWLAIAACCVDLTNAGDSVSAYPTNYGNGVLTKSASSNSSVGLGVGHRALASVTSEDPGAFTNTSRAWLAKTLLIPPLGPQTISVGVASEVSSAVTVAPVKPIRKVIGLASEQEMGVEEIGYLTTQNSSSDRVQNTLPVAAYSTGAYELKALVAMDNWEPASFRATAISHHRGQITCRVRGGANAGDPGNPDLVWHDGATTQTIASNAQFPDGLTAYQWVWLRYVFNPNNGANRVADFYYSLDPPDTDIDSVSWTQIGTQVSAATTTVRAATSTVAGFGGDSTMTGATPNFGRYAVARLRLNGTIIHSPDLRDGDQGWASPPATDDQGNSWAFNGAAAWQANTVGGAGVVDPLKVAHILVASEVESAQVIDVGGPSVIVVGTASETELARAIAALKPIFVAVGQASETELARAVPIATEQVISVGTVYEGLNYGETYGENYGGEVASTVRGLKTALIGGSSEAESAQAVSANVDQSIPVGGSSEAGSAQAVVPQKRSFIGTASEVELARAVAAVHRLVIGQASEVELARAVAALKTAAVVVASESGAGMAVDAVKTAQVGTSSESEASGVVVPGKAVDVGAAAEAEVALFVSAGQEQTIAVGLASEVASAIVVDALKAVDVGAAAEVGAAQAVAAVKPIVVDIGAAAESGLAAVVRAVKRVAMSQALEAGSAQAVAAQKSVVVSYATESGVAVPVGGQAVVGIVTASETETARTIVVGQDQTIVIGSASEIELARSVGVIGEDLFPVGVATEAGSARAVTPVKPIFVPVGVVSEASMAVALTIGRAVAIGDALEVSAAMGVTPVKPIVVIMGSASEVGSARPVVPVKPIVTDVGSALEVGAAQGVSLRRSVDVGHAAEAASARAVVPVKPIFVQVGRAVEVESGRTVSVVYVGESVVPGTEALLWDVVPGAELVGSGVSYKPVLVVKEGSDG